MENDITITNINIFNNNNHNIENKIENNNQNNNNNIDNNYDYKINQLKKEITEIYKEKSRNKVVIYYFIKN